MPWSRQIDFACAVGVLVAGCGARTTPTAVACGEKHACVLMDDGSIRCWGQWVGYPITPPARPGPYSAIDAGFYQCALDPRGVIACWDRNGPVGAPEGTFVALSAGWGLACGLTSDGAARCRDLTDGTAAVDPPPSPEPLRLVRIGWSGPCGLRLSDGSPICWAQSPAVTPPAEPLTALAVGAGHACGVRGDGSLVCWGEPGGTPSTLVPPVGQFVDVKIEDASDCALRVDGTIACWGSWSNAGFTGPSGAFKDFSIGEEFGCGLRTDDTVDCWGLNDVGQASPPTDLTR